MSIHVAMHHVTRYRYDRQVSLSPHLIRLRPAPHCRTTILSYSQRVEPAAHFLNWQQDPYSNYVARATFPDRTNQLRVDVDLLLEVAVYNPFDFFLEPQAESFPFTYEPSMLRDLQPFLQLDPITPGIDAYLPTLPRGPARTIDLLVDVNRKVSRDIRYVIRMEPGIQTCDETLALASGSCRDSAWLLVQLLRRLGIAARFASGYLIQLAPDVRPEAGGAPGPVHDFVDLHAWCEAYLPGAGWIGFDPTSGLLAGEGHIPLACTPEPSTAAPIAGRVDESEVTFTHEMSVVRIHESPRVTRPYTDAQWRAIESVASSVDRELSRLDTRLTMGGEPTFVGVDEVDAPEWNMAALGGGKRARAADLLRRLQGRLAPGALLHFGQGKWYPGEPLPRWALGCYWRTDGEPVWRDPSRYADEANPDGAHPEDAERFLCMLARRLGISGEFIQCGFEDVWYYLWRERRLPVNVDPFDARLDDALERERLRCVFARGLDTPVGYALPLDPRSNGGWRSGRWFLRDQRMYLLPGDSPMGYRLPLDSLPWAAEGDLPIDAEPDPFARHRPLPSRAEIAMQWQESAAPRDGAKAPRRGESARGTLRTALCVEPRGGVLYVFMPPVTNTDKYLALVAAVEDTAEALRRRVLIEGYQPPLDDRLRSFLVTPDPGVIEVNVSPCRDWTELSAETTILYEEARRARLTTEKFMLDGRHTGTGGGNHFVLGGPTASDSPFLRRPDLLRSLASYWHNHPSLSYLFSGLFIGPTSQAPRVDEARHDSVYEIEIAFAHLPAPGSAAAATAPPWLVDRELRNLLVDVTGNTHRAEFCIDKLYPPESAAGRRGLLELRAFEMPPHARMSLAQQLFLRALVARFWKEPYDARLKRWGTELHDRFMLPYFVWQDFADVLEELRDRGYAFEDAWFLPHFEFRFPVAGEFTTRAAHLTLRQALEPWPVLGEEGAIGTTVRYVDSSVERLQVQITGLIGDRFVVTCNGRTIPLQPTGRNGEYVAGVRYRAWHPPSALHPGVPVHAPLTFDIVDTWMRRSVGGCRYHVSHPGGLSYDRFPVNSYEAESRRLSRFERLGHTPGLIDAAPAEPTREFPFTLDLRT